MRAHEFITESTELTLDEKSFGNSMGAVTTFDNQNMNNGQLYNHWRMGIALAGAPDFPTPPSNFIGGNPMFHAYTDAEQKMLDFAAKQIGDNSGRKWAQSKSTEREDTNKISPTRKTKDYRKK